MSEDLDFMNGKPFTVTQMRDREKEAAEKLKNSSVYLELKRHRDECLEKMIGFFVSIYNEHEMYHMHGNGD